MASKVAVKELDTRRITLGEIKELAEKYGLDLKMVAFAIWLITINQTRIMDVIRLEELMKLFSSSE